MLETEDITVGKQKKKERTVSGDERLVHAAELARGVELEDMGRRNGGTMDCCWASRDEQQAKLAADLGWRME